MNKNIMQIAGTLDSFLVLDIFKDPTEIVKYVETQCNDVTAKLKSKPHVSFYSQKDPNTNSLAYLRCPSIKTVEEYTPELQLLADTIDESVNIIKLIKYENGSKFITPHADKTIDLDNNVPIYNIRLGAPRKFVLKHKTNNTIITTVIPHNAMFILGLKTNAEFTHAVPEEASVTDCTYSIILRKSVTFKDTESDFLWGTRTRFQTYNDLKEYLATNAKVNNTKSELIKLWSIENECIVKNDHYTNYSLSVASKSLV